MADSLLLLPQSRRSRDRKMAVLRAWVQHLSRRRHRGMPRRYILTEERTKAPPPGPLRRSEERKSPLTAEERTGGEGEARA